MRKDIDTLLDNIEEDIEIMGDSHVVYAWIDRDTEEIVDYDFIPDVDYIKAYSLQELKEELLNRKNHVGITDQIEIACRKIVLDAGEKLKEIRTMQIHEKSDWKNLVTTYDTATQHYLVEKLTQVLPEATFLCEEEGQTDISGEYVFIIDPIDGTSNFINGMNLSCIAVALAKNKQLQWGIVYNPYTEEFFEGVHKQGAFLNGKPIHVSPKPLRESLVAFGTSPYYAEYKRRSFQLAEKVLDFCIDVRRLGSAELDLCYVASGRAGAYFELLLSPWDYAAGSIILTEAGGRIATAEGKEMPFAEKTGVIAANAAAFEEICSIILE